MSSQESKKMSKRRRPRQQTRPRRVENSMNSPSILPNNHQLADATKFPLWENCLPAIKWKETQPEDYPSIKDGQNYAVHCGFSNLVVIDLDVEHHPGQDGIGLFEKMCPDGELPKTFTVETASGGLHLYFKDKYSFSIGRHPNMWDGIDVLGGPGYVVGPGSHRKGMEGKPDGPYEVVADIEIAELPDWLRKLISGKTKETKETEKGSAAYEQFTSRLKEMGKKRDGVNWQCPSHDDRTPSMTVTDKGDTVAFFCHAGCDWQQILSDMGMVATELFDGNDYEPWGPRMTFGDQEQPTNASGNSETHAEPSGELELVPMSSITMRRTEWFWDTGTTYPGSGGRIPNGTLTIGVGRPGAGKGQFACWLAAQVTNGTLPGALKDKPKGVIFYSTEDDYPRTIGPRLKAAGADLDKVFIFSTEAEDTSGKFVIMKIAQHLDRLKYLIRQYDIGLIILDPLLSAMSANSDPNNDPSVRGEIEPLQMMLAETGCTGFGITHFRKMHDDDILNMISGSGAFARVIRSAQALGSEKDEEGSITRVISTVKNSYGRTDLPSFTYTFEECKVPVSDGVTYVSKLVMGEETDTSVEDIHERKVTGTKKTTKSSQAIAWLNEKLKDGPVAKDDLMAMHTEENPGFSWGTVDKASAGAVVSDKSFGGKATWKLAF
jgi:AAA domain/Bifunctional DNA primase/polymerase, N-terminal